MKIEKLKIEKEKFNINLKFYFFLKHLVKTKLTNNQAKALLKICILNSKIDFKIIIAKMLNQIKTIIKTDSPKQKFILEIIYKI